MKRMVLDMRKTTALLATTLTFNDKLVLFLLNNGDSIESLSSWFNDYVIGSESSGLRNGFAHHNPSNNLWVWKEIATENKMLKVGSSDLVLIDDSDKYIWGYMDDFELNINSSYSMYLNLIQYYYG